MHKGCPNFFIIAFTPRLRLVKKPHSTPTLLLIHLSLKLSAITLRYVYSAFMEVPECLIGGYYGTGAGQFSPEKPKAAEYFAVDEYLLDFSNEDVAMTCGFFDGGAGNCSDSSTVTAVDSCNSSVSGGDNQFSGNIGSRSFSEAQFSSELCIPYDDVAELEWLSNFVEDSFSTDEKDVHALPFLSGCSTAHASETPSSSETTTLISHPSECAKSASFFQHEALPLPSKARSRRSRASHGDWSTRLLHLAAPADTKPPKTDASKNRGSSNSESPGRKCQHCAAEKTPQWRTGPMGPKTLCNACGVRYKSGRLVPEYRPAASPTFVSTKHSNSHRKVLELRRQKELQRAQQQTLLSQTSIFGTSNGGDEYLIRHHDGHGFSHMI